MRRKRIIEELEKIAVHNSHVKSLLQLHKDGYKPIDETMLEMVMIMAFDSYALREALNKERAKGPKVNHFIDDS